MRPQGTGRGDCALIAEVKSFPSKSHPRRLDPPQLARLSQGATCLILTDALVQGSLAIVVRRAAISHLCCAKFIYDTYQVSKSARAQAATDDHLAALDDAAPRHRDAGLALGMDVLLEVHDAPTIAP